VFRGFEKKKKISAVNMYKSFKRKKKRVCFRQTNKQKMSRRHNVELAGVGTADILRQELVRELALLEQHQKLHEQQKKEKEQLEADGFTNVDENSYRSIKKRTAPQSKFAQQLNHNFESVQRAMCIEGAVADTELSTAQRAIQREEQILRYEQKSEREKQKNRDALKLCEERAEWASQLIAKQEREARETLELLAGSTFVGTERKERSRRQREKVDAQVQAYLEHQQLVDDLHDMMVDRWVTRDQVLREAAAAREAREQIELEWQTQREHVFLDEGDVFYTHS
jgi:hypothetical protein